MSAKDKESKSIQTRLKNYFKNVAKTNNTRESCEYRLTEEKERELSKASPLPTRYRAMKELHDIVVNCKLDDISIGKIWGHIEDLLEPSQSQETRYTAFAFLQTFFRGQYERLGILRAKFFHFIRFHNHPEDILQRFELLKALTDNGRDILHFEGDVGAFLLSWFPDITKAGPAQDFMLFLENVIKFNAVFMYEHVTTGFVQCICEYCCSSTEPTEVLSCLSILDTIVAYSNMPPDSLPQFIGALCRAVNGEQYSQTSWRIMRNLLGTHMGHSTLFTLCRILQEPELRDDTSLLRGAIFYIKMGLWGAQAQAVTSLRIPPSAVLPSILQVVKPVLHAGAVASSSSGAGIGSVGGASGGLVSGSGGGGKGAVIVIAYEVILCVQSLVDTMGKELIESNWEVILVVLDHIIDELEVFRPTTAANLAQGSEVPRVPMSANVLQVSNHLHQTLDTIEGLIELRQFNGDYDQFYKLVEKCSNARSEKSVKQLVTYLEQDITPAKTIWLTNLYDLLSRYFRVEKRTAIRLQVLEVLEKVVMLNKMRFEDELIDKIVIPYMTPVDLDRDTRIRSACGQFLIDLCSECETKACIQMLEILERLLNRPFDMYEQYSVSASEAETADTLVVVKGLIQLFQQKIMKLPSAHAIRIYDILVGHLERHYKNQVVFEKNNKIRLSIFDCFLNMRADKLYHLGYLTSSAPNTIKFSPYICVTYRNNTTASSNLTSSVMGANLPGATSSLIGSSGGGGSGGGAMGSPPPASPSVTSIAVCAVTHVCIKAGFKTVVTCLKMERDPEVLGMVSDRLPKVLENKAFILSKQGNNDIFMLVEVLHSMFTDKSNMTDLNLKSKMLSILASLASYHAYIETDQQRKMIYCLYKYGLVREWSRQCIITLTTCTLEMQEVMVKMLPDLLLTLSKISAVTHVAIPILEFLSTVTILPTVFASFAAEQYMAVFAISLPYTNPFKFNHYTVSLAHHVIAVWFLKCRLQFRKDFVRFITKGLQTNVRGTPFFDDSSKIDLSKLNQDSSDRKRSSSLTEPSARRRERASTVSSRMDSANGTSSSKPSIDFNRPSITEDKKLITFYEELTETCIDLMARYTFSPCSALPKRLPTADFLLHGGQTMSWLMGNRVITVTTSGCAQRTLRRGLCEKCWSSCRTEQSMFTYPRTPEDSTRPVSLHATRSSSHEKDDSHSNTITRQNSNSNSNTSVSSPTEETKKLSDKLEQQLPPRLQMFLDGPDRGEKCACWCQGWAEIHVRRPTGDMSWVMRIQNQTSFQHSVYDFPLNEVSTLYMASLQQAGLHVAAAAAAAAAATAASFAIESGDTLSLAAVSGGDRSNTALQHTFSGGSVTAPISIPMSPKHSPSRQTSHDSLDADELDVGYEDLEEGSDGTGKSRNPVRRSNSSPEMTNWKNPFMRGEMSGTTTGTGQKASADQKGSSSGRERSVEADLALGGVLEAKCLIEEEKRTGTRGKLSYTKDMRVSCEAIPEEIAGTTPPTIDNQQQTTSTHPALLSSLSCPSPPPSSTDHISRTIHTVPVSPLVLSNPNQPPIFPTSVTMDGGGNVTFRTSKSESTESMGCDVDRAGIGALGMPPLITGKPPQSPTQTSPRLVRHQVVGDVVYEVQKSSSLVLEKTYSSSSTTSLSSDIEKKRYQMRPPYSSQSTTTSTTSTSSSTSMPHHQRDRGYTVSVMNTSASNRKPLNTHPGANNQPQTPRKEQPRSGISPSFVFLQLYHAAQFGPSNCEKPLPVDAAHLVQIQRALKVLDSIPPYETHKIGVIYVGHGQSGNEVEILRNRYGSVRYIEFLRRLGTVIKLQDVDPLLFFLGGLEQNGADGTFAYVWQDDVIRVMFHVATLMPNKDSDPHCTNKKSHIGNNNITIVYNESGEEYNLNTLKGQFNFAAIVVQPLDHNTNKVTVTAKEELIKLIGVHEPKLVSDQNAAIMARQLALHTNLASMVSRSINLKEDDPYASNWLERLRKIKNLRSKIEQTTSDTPSNQSSEDRTYRKGQMEDFTEYT